MNEIHLSHLRRVHHQPIHRVVSGAVRRGAGRTPQRLVHLYPIGHLRTVAGVPGVAGLTDLLASEWDRAQQGRGAELASLVVLTGPIP